MVFSKNEAQLYTMLPKTGKCYIQSIQSPLLFVLLLLSITYLLFRGR